MYFFCLQSISQNAHACISHPCIEENNNINIFFLVSFKPIVVMQKRRRLGNSIGNDVKVFWELTHPLRRSLYVFSVLRLSKKFMFECKYTSYYYRMNIIFMYSNPINIFLKYSLYTLLIYISYCAFVYISFLLRCCENHLKSFCSSSIFGK